MDTFEELNDLLAVVGLSSTLSTNRDRWHLLDENKSSDDIDISVDDRVEQYMYSATPYIPAEHENDPATVSSADPDDPQSDLEMIQNQSRNGCDCNKQCFHQFNERKLLDYVLNLREMERNEKEMYIMGTRDKVASNARCEDGERKRTFVQI